MSADFVGENSGVEPRQAAFFPGGEVGGCGKECAAAARVGGEHPAVGALHEFDADGGVLGAVIGLLAQVRFACYRNNECKVKSADGCY